MIALLCLMFAFVLFIIAGVVGVPDWPWRNRLVCIGLSLWVLAELIGRGLSLKQ